METPPQVQLDGNRRYYRFLLFVCRLVHEQLLVDEKSGRLGSQTLAKSG